MKGSRQLRGATAAAVALLLTGCGQVHPGAAAVVGGTRIPLDELDSLSVAYCQVTVAIADSQGQPQEPREGVDTRRTVLGAMIQLEIARRAAASLGVEVAPSAYAADEQNIQALLDTVDAQYADEVRDLVRINGETNALLVAIGAHQMGQDVPEVDPPQAAQTGQEFVTEFGAEVDVDIDPRLGLAPDGQVLAQTGSLSVAVSDEASIAPDPAAAASRVDSLPDSQVCR